MQKELKQLEKAYGIEWKKYLISNLFDIDNTLSFNKDSLTEGNDYDYVTRTSQNQGILQTTGFVNSENINLAGTWSLGLLQMDFFYRERTWYAGQFVRKIVPKFTPSKEVSTYFTVLLNKMKHKLLTVLVRDVDKTFLNMSLLLPTKNSQICFDYIEAFINKITEFEFLTKIKAYLDENNLINTNLTIYEKNALNILETTEFKDFLVTDIFTIKNTGNILSSWIKENSGTTPYLCASAANNSVSSYIQYDEDYLDKGNCVFIGGKTFVVTYQKDDFFSNDSHNLTLTLNNEGYRNRICQLFLATCVKNSLGHKYSWGDSISSSKIKKDSISLPVRDGQPDYEFMENYISAIQKLTVKKVISYLDEKKSKLAS